MATDGFSEMRWVWQRFVSPTSISDIRKVVNAASNQRFWPATLTLRNCAPDVDSVLRPQLNCRIKGPVLTREHGVGQCPVNGYDRERGAVIGIRLFVSGFGAPRDGQKESCLVTCKFIHLRLEAETEGKGRQSTIVGCEEAGFQEAKSKEAGRGGCLAVPAACLVGPPDR